MNNTLIITDAISQSSQESSNDAYNERRRLDARIQYEKMRELEESSAYVRRDYLSESLIGTKVQTSVNIECRVTMIEWCYQVIDYANLHRETVTIAMGLLDRFLSCRCKVANEVLLCRDLYQLVTMSALFIAIKMNETIIISASEFAQLSRGRFQATDIVNMESSILKDLQWRTSAPTTHTFLRHIIAMLPADLQQTLTSSQMFTELSNFQLDLSAGDYSFVKDKASFTAVAALLTAYANSRFSMSFKNANVDYDYSSFAMEVSHISGIDVQSADIQYSISRLVALVSSNGVEVLSPSQIEILEKSHAKYERELSPVCVGLIG